MLSTTVVVHNLCDIVSKNGNLLLNVGLRADGTLPDDQRAVLEEVGHWLRVNGAAIYDTRPWAVYGEGPSQVTDGYFHERIEPFSPQDIRFTTKEGVLYAIVLGWPADRHVLIRALALGASVPASEITSVRLLGTPERIVWGRGPEGLTVVLPAQPPCGHAYTLAIT